MELAIQSSMSTGTQRMFPSLPLIVPHKQQSMQDLSKRATTGYHTRTSSKHGTTCLTMASTMCSSSPQILILWDGTPSWKLLKSWTNPWQPTADWQPLCSSRMTPSLLQYVFPPQCAWNPLLLNWGLSRNPDLGGWPVYPHATPKQCHQVAPKMQPLSPWLQGVGPKKWKRQNLDQS